MTTGSNRALTTKRIAVLAVMVALIIVFSFVPISLGVPLALMIIPSLIIAQTEDFNSVLFLGLFLGIINYVAWFTTKAASPLAIIFQNPFVCILPRILIGVVAYFVSKGLRAVVAKSGKSFNKAQIVTMETAFSAIGTAFGVATNTFFVSVFTMIFLNGDVMSNGTSINLEYILTWFGINFGIEISVFSVLVPAMVLALKKARLSYQPLYFVSPTATSAVAEDVVATEEKVDESEPPVV